jgi:hypothetical protein
MTFLFGPKSSHTPTVVTPTPIQESLKSNIADDTVRKELAQKRKATMLTQQSQLGTPNLAVEKLGAGA